MQFMLWVSQNLLFANKWSVYHTFHKYELENFFFKVMELQKEILYKRKDSLCP